MNPVTRHLLDRIDDPALADFALGWDALEELVVSIHRAGACSEEAQQSFERRRQAAGEAYAPLAEALRPHWRKTRIDGEPLLEDPFAAILALQQGPEAIGDRQLLRRLPPAREALNGLLLERAVDERL